MPLHLLQPLYDANTAGGGFGDLPDWDLTDLYPTADGPEFAADMAAGAFGGMAGLGVDWGRPMVIVAILGLVYLGCRRAGAGRRTAALLTVGSVLLSILLEIQPDHG